LYTIEVKYTYNLNDGVGNQVITITREVRTLTKSTPEVTIFDVSSTQTSISFDIDVLDAHDVGSISKIELFKGEELIDTYDFIEAEWPNYFVFENLLSNNLYTIKVTYTYDLNDGAGEQDLVTGQIASTFPQNILINSIVVLNQQISTGDTVIFSVSINNPDNVTLTGVNINGNEIQLDSTSTTTNLRFRFVINDDMGVASYIIESFILENGYILNVNDNNIIEFFVMANVFVVDVIQSDGNYYGNMYDTYLVTFNQPIANYINKVIANGVNPTIQTINIDNIIVVDDYTIEIPITSSGNVGSRNFKIVSIDYEVNSVTYTTNIDYGWSEYIVTSEVSYIETADDLLTIGSYGVYILSNDIDLTGVNWSIINFNGVLLGNGHKITNLTIIDYSSTERVKFAMFDTLYGVINDLYIENLFISVDKSNDVKLAGLAITNYGVINNVNVSGTIEVVSNGSSEIGGITVNNEKLIVNSFVDISITNNSKTAYIGGISGVNSSSAIIRNSSVNSIIISSSEITYSNHYIGGLTGYNQGEINEVAVETELTAHSSFIYAGGLTGYNHGVIRNSYTIGIVNSTLQTGYSYGYSAGFVGFNSQTGQLMNCYSNVSSNIPNNSLNWSSGFVGENQGTVNNSFSSGSGFNQPFVQTQSGVFTNNHSIYTNNAINSIGLIYKETISEINTIMNELWDPSIWDFSQIDYINFNYPILK
ncbi:MAG: hypothetical protein LKF54_06140, partial [Bacilli bacterium]|nr:hypothetical protein [Bacilli bacterium]